MAVALTTMRDLLLPGLQAAAYRQPPMQWDKLFTATQINQSINNPAVWAELDAIAQTTVSPQAAVAMGVAAILIKNPEVTRRGIFGR